MRALALGLVLALLATGCLGGGTDPGDDGGTPPPPATLQAPWWSIGDAWVVAFEQAGQPARSTTLVNFANNTFNDPPHFWLGVRDRGEALDHVFFENNPFLGRIHWEMLAPHEKGMHSAMYAWPLEDGHRWTSPILFGKEDLALEATRRDDGTFAVAGEARKDGADFAYDYDPATRWFRALTITEPDGSARLRATVEEHRGGEKGTFYFLRGRDYHASDGGATGEEEKFTVKEEGATSIAFLLDVQAQGPVAAIEFVDPAGQVFHRETLPLGQTADKVVEVSKKPPAGEWRLRYVGAVGGTILVRGVIEYKASI